MGYIEHDTVIVETYLPDDRGLAQVVGAWRAALPAEWQALVIGPVQAVVNSFAWWVFLPDGSKEGWPESDLGNRYRAEFLAFFADDDYVCVRWGQDAGHDLRAATGIAASVTTNSDDDHLPS